MPHICVFDVNETLLDLRALDPQFARIFGDADARQVWFTQMLQNAFVATITGPYRDFGALGAAALEMVAVRRGVTISHEEKNGILHEMRRLPPHPETQFALERLQQAGLRLVTLTNSTAKVA
ncbi:MAG: hypothetical protein PVS3B1_38720 [Ktedonobacteraceae bacterium]